MQHSISLIRSCHTVIATPSKIILYKISKTVAILNETRNIITSRITNTLSYLYWLPTESSHSPLLNNTATV